MCTVELSKKLIINQPSYSLGKLIKSLGIPMSDRHRASGDALATVQLFKLLLEKDLNKTIIQSSIKYFDRRGQKEKLKNLIDETPAIQGVFYIHNINGKVIYLGKGKNIKREVNKLFLKGTKRALKIQERVEKISFDKTGNDLFTSLKYNLQLDVLSPKFNSKEQQKLITKDFNNDDFIIIEKGRTIDENAIILVEDNEVYGYGFTNLNYQENKIDILKSILTPIDNKIKTKNIIKNYLHKNKIHKIIRL